MHLPESTSVGQWAYLSGDGTTQWANTLLKRALVQDPATGDRIVIFKAQQQLASWQRDFCKLHQNGTVSWHGSDGVLHVESLQMKILEVSRSGFKVIVTVRFG